MSQIEKIVAKTICSIQPILKHSAKVVTSDDPYNQSCFEILGFDIMLDSNYRAWLIEVNHAPSFNSDSVVDFKVKGNLIFDTFRILRVTSKMKKKLITLRK